MAEKTPPWDATRIAILVIVVVFFVSSFAFSGLIIYEQFFKEDSSEATTTSQAEQQAQEEQVSKEPLEGYQAEPFDKAAVTELKVEEIKPGTGKEATAESTVQANYFGWVSDGTIFDSSQQNGVASPVEFPLSGVIAGWTQGLTGAKEGSVRKLTIPADMAYGEAGRAPVIGANEPLVFIVELKAVK